MRLTTKLRLTLFLKLVVWLVTFTSCAFAYSKGNATQEIVNIEIAGTPFHIPRGYIWHEGAWKDGKRDGVNTWALLPDMQPRTESNKSEFDGNGGFRNVVGFLLHRHNKPVSSQEGPDWQRKRKQQSFDWKVKHFAQGEAVDGPFGFKMYLTRNGSSFGELLYRTMPNDSLYFIECDRDSSVPSPSCSSEVYLSDKLYVRYTYGKLHLKDWLVIDKKVRELIRGFENSQNSVIKGEK